MKKNLMRIMCCPACKGDLEFTIKKENATDIIEGSIRCKKCGVIFPIHDGTADLRPQGHDGKEYVTFNLISPGPGGQADKK
jgi:uncharacterized protein